MIFDKLYAENLYSFEKLELDFSKYTKGTTIILGKNLDMNSDNAAGKSNILKIIYYAIWGKDIKGVALPKIIRDKSDTGSLVVFTFKKESNTYVVVRFMNYKKNMQILGMPVKGSGMYFFINKKPYIIEKDSTKTQGQIDSVLGCSPKVWLHSVMTRQRKEDSETFLGAVDSKKKEMLSEILDLNYYDTALKKVKDDITLTSKTLDKITLKISSLEEQITTNKTQKNNYQNKITQLIDENTKIKVDLESQYSSLVNELKLLKEIQEIPTLDLSKERMLVSEIQEKRKPLLDEIAKENEAIALQAKKEEIVKNSEVQINETNDQIKENKTILAENSLKMNDIVIIESELLNTSLSDSQLSYDNMIKQLKDLRIIRDQYSLKQEKMQNELLNNDKIKITIQKINDEIEKIKEEAECVECKRKFNENESVFFNNLIILKQNNKKLEELKLESSVTIITELSSFIDANSNINENILQKESEIEILQVTINDLKESISKNNVNKDKYNELLNSNNKINEKLIELSARIELINKDVLSAKVILKNIPDFLKLLEKTKKELAILDAQLSEKESIIKDFDSFVKSIETENQLRREKSKRVTEIEEKLSTIGDNVAPYQEFLISADDKLKQQEEELVRSKEIKLELDEKLKYLFFWEIGFSKTGIRSFIIDDVINLLNHYVKSYIDVLSNGVMQIVFEPESTNSKDVISNKISTKYFINGVEKDFDLTSGGETQRLVLGVDLAISEVVEARSGNKFSLKFLDEPFTNIDSAGQLKALALFRKLSEERNGFFIISHDKELQTSCDNAIYVVKKNDVSKLVSAEEFFNAE
jgi:DNA repair exonuclease SbcCD ATPase subunit